MRIEDRGSRSFGKYLLNRARDQNAGGGRINWVIAGRKIGETSATGLDRTAATKTGAAAAV